MALQVIGLIALLYLAGSIATFITNPFGRTVLNPVQDYIRWMPYWLQVVLWLPLMGVWWGTAALRLERWFFYDSHEEIMEYEINKQIAQIEAAFDNTGTISYRIPSPKEWKEHGIEAADVTVELL